MRLIVRPLSVLDEERVVWHADAKRRMKCERDARHVPWPNARASPTSASGVVATMDERRTSARTSNERVELRVVVPWAANVDSNVNVDSNIDSNVDSNIDSKIDSNIDIDARWSVMPTE